MNSRTEKAIQCCTIRLFILFSKRINSPLKPSGPATGLGTTPQLYNLASDMQEQTDLNDSNTKKAMEMKTTLDKILASPTRPGYQ